MHIVIALHSIISCRIELYIYIYIYYHGILDCGSAGAPPRGAAACHLGNTNNNHNNNRHDNNHAYS